MNWQRRILTAILVLIGLTGEISDPTPVAAATHYPLSLGMRGNGMVVGDGADPRVHSVA
jgi:hypothetical protein